MTTTPELSPPTATIKCHDASHFCCVLCRHNMFLAAVLHEQLQYLIQHTHESRSCTPVSTHQHHKLMLNQPTCRNVGSKPAVDCFCYQPGLVAIAPPTRALEAAHTATGACLWAYTGACLWAYASSCMPMRWAAAAHLAPWLRAIQSSQQLLPLPSYAV